jgi:HAD superfamily hydrolase (TIGR01509 family)
LPRFRAAILDMDGLALDTEAAYFYAWRRAATELSIPLTEEFCQTLSGLHADQVQQAMIDSIGHDFQPTLFYRAAERHWRNRLASQGLAQMPGLSDLLAEFRVRGIPYGLATNSDGRFATECLRAAAVETEFEVVVTRDQVANGKPEPDLFLAAAERLKVSPADCLALEDSEPGLAAARAAGMLPVLVQRREDSRSRLAPGALLAVETLVQVTERLRGTTPWID